MARYAVGFVGELAAIDFSLPLILGPRLLLDFGLGGGQCSALCLHLGEATGGADITRAASPITSAISKGASARSD